MVVTKIELLTKTKYKIDIDGQFAFVLYKGELSRYGIAEDQEIAEETIGKIETEVLMKRAKLRALHLLEDMDRTEGELYKKLVQGMYPEEIVKKTLEYVKSFGYLDDLRYAENFIVSRREKKSRKEIYVLLSQKGIEREKIEQAFYNCYTDTSETEAVRGILKKKKWESTETDERKIRKMYAYLARKGFRYETVRQVIQNHDDNA
ncbi:MULTISPECIES: regulatory protein RecX [Mediterraneibacter]|jgi:regulatory protein|uniref:regulatory protein RecX n=1 Tax=Mediterraneibacter TaxID=2316020 RepID=UPI000E4F2B27|nr:regulatory protein RecX [Mediterraneibacter massiliensis]RGT73166.1 regulatory protein RecX [Ruminococcus sp. AF18-22]